MLAAAVEVTALHGMEGLREMLTPAAIAQHGNLDPKVVRRYLAEVDDDKDEVVTKIIEAVSSHLATPRAMADSIAAMAADESEHPADEEPLTVFTRWLADNYSNQSTAISWLATWILQAAAMPASSVWQGKKLADPGGTRLARQILDDRAALYEGGLDEFTVMFASALARFERSPRLGTDARDIVRALWALQDGMWMQRLNDPGLFPPEQAANLMVTLAVAMTVDGPSAAEAEPPGTVADAELHSLLLATVLSDDSEVITRLRTARRAKIPVAEVRRLFPSDEDLLVASVRAATAAALAPLEGPDLGQHARSHVRGALVNLNRAVAAHRTLFDASGNDEIESRARAAVSRSIRASGSWNCSDPDGLASDLVRWSVSGSMDDFDVVDALLRA